MGWFKESKEPEKPKKKSKSPEKCPVCGELSFQKATAYMTSTKKETNGQTIIYIEDKDFHQFTGNDTGFCKTCGGIARGWIFANAEDVINELLVKDYNSALRYVMVKLAQASKSGANETEALYEAVKEVKEVQEANANVKSHKGYYILLMLIENESLGLGGKARDAYTLLKAMRTMNKESHQQLRGMLEKICPQFF